jgi:succinate dehydrogenase/fumarate reductase flavoprotein subunit
MAKGGTVNAEIPVQMGAQLRADVFRLLESKAGMDTNNGRIEVQPMFVGAQGPIRIDVNCKTTVEGLWAIGDASSLGSGWTGARASGTHPGGSIGFAVLSGFRAGKSAADFASTAAKRETTCLEIDETRKRVLGPLDRKSEVGVREAMYQIHEAVVPIKYNFHREGSRLKEALSIVAKAKQNLPRVGAKNFHELSQYHQAESMAMAAEWILGAALVREESRGTQQRQDFPKRDDKNWLKWVIIQNRNGASDFSTEPVPLEKYKLKP